MIGVAEQQTAGQALYRRAKETAAWGYSGARSAARGVAATPGAWKVIAAAGAVGVTGFAVYELVTAFSGPAGGSCSQVGTPCYTATNPYEKEFMACFVQYQKYSSQFYREDATAGTGLTSAQISILNSIENCMNEAGANLAKAAKPFVPANPLAILSSDIGTGAEIAFAGAAFYLILKGLASWSVVRATGSQAASAAQNATLRNAINDGTVDASNASDFESTAVPLMKDQAATNESVIVDTYTSEDIITPAEASAVAGATDSALEEDLATTVEDLGGL